LIEEVTKLQARAAPPSALAPTTRHTVDPVKPSEFDRDQGKGHAFLNSCLIYLHVCQADFIDNQTKILWVLLFMKSRQAAVFAAQVFAKEVQQDQPAYWDWAFV
jgi:hypothetical protein